MTIKILIVDDEPDIEVLIQQRYRRETRAGVYEFLFARNGVAALAVLEADPGIEVVLSDINMPVMDGLTLLGRLRELGALAPGAVVVSAYGDMANIRAAMNQGAFDFLTKPIDFQDFEVTIQKTLAQVRGLREALAGRDRLVALERDLDLAAQIQRTFLPRIPPPFDERTDYTVSATMIPARAVGGDFFDYFLIPTVEGERLGLVIGDVAGKGMPAALFMAVSRTLLRAEAFRGTSPAECLSQVNRQLLRDSPSHLFVTLFYASFDPRTGRLWYSNGGHNPPVLLRSSGAVEFLSERSPLLGALEEARYITGQVTLFSGDRLLLYTDGVTEAMNVSQDQFGRDRLLDVLLRCPERTPESLVDAVVAAVQKFTGEAPQSDDLTVLTLSYAGTGIPEGNKV